VRGSEHYDRQGLTEYLLQAQDTAIWVMGARRMGKTSLLRHLEHLADTVELPGQPENQDPHTDTPEPDTPATTRYVPLFWDLQGCVSQDDLSQELSHALEDAHERFTRLKVDIEGLAGLDAVSLLRQLNRRLNRIDRRLLLLIDEAEVLVALAHEEAAWLARLRKVLQEGHQRTIIASTKLLATMTEESVEWVTSPFLFGFRLVNLQALDRAAAEKLVRQAQAQHSVKVHPEVMTQIYRYTNGHPYFMQWLCARLFVPLSDELGYLRDVQEEDLVVDPLMAGLFQVDMARLSQPERRVLYSVAETGRCTVQAPIIRVGEKLLPAPAAILRSLEEFGHLRQAEGLLEVGNEFLYRWLLAHLDTLWAQLEAEASEDEEAKQDEAEDDIARLARLLGIAPERIRDLINIKISSNEEFFKAIQGFFIQIRHLVEQDDGHRLLLTTTEKGTGKGEIRLRSEDDVQIALKHWLRPMCRALNIHMDREPLTGRGLLDFKFSLGHDFRCLVEVKLFNSPRLQDGLAIQLPIYLLADHAEYGLYVPIFLKSPAYATALERLRAAATEQAERHGVTIQVIDIRAWKPKTASRADSVGEFDRYRLPHVQSDDESLNHASDADEQEDRPQEDGTPTNGQSPDPKNPQRKKSGEDS
jgi:hypothetical protein